MNWRDQNIRLRRLEAEAVYILRETVAEFANPVMLYSVGKDSGVMLHIAQKAFAPRKPPFPLLHIDTTWKFREMIAFRNATVARLGMDLLVHTNEDALARGISPFTSGSAVHTQSMKTDALRQALEKWRFDSAMNCVKRVVDVERDPFRNPLERLAIKIDHGAAHAQQGPSVGQVFKTGDGRLRT